MHNQQLAQITKPSLERPKSQSGGSPSRDGWGYALQAGADLMTGLLKRRVELVVPITELVTGGVPVRELLNRLGKVEALLGQLVQARTVKDWYTTVEVAEMLSKDSYTVREWARLGRIRAK